MTISSINNSSIELKTSLFGGTYSIKELITKNQTTFLKTALIGIGAVSLTALVYGCRLSTQNIQAELLSNIPKLALGICSIPVLIGLNSLITKKKEGSSISKSGISPVTSEALLSPSDLEVLRPFTPECGNSPQAESIFRDLPKNLNDLEVLRLLTSGYGNSLEEEIDKIMRSEECFEAFPYILGSRSNSPSKKLNLIRNKIRYEVKVFKLDLIIESADSIILYVEKVRKIYMAKAQIHFADVLVAELERSYQNQNNHTLDEIKRSINLIKYNNTISVIEKASLINEAIKEHLNADDSEESLKNSVVRLNLNDKNIDALLPCIGEFSNLKYLFLKYNRLTFSSTTSYISKETSLSYTPCDKDGIQFK